MIRAWLFALLCLLALEARAVTAIGTPAPGGAVNQATPLNVTHDSGAAQTNKVTIAAVYAYDPTATIGVPTYNGVAMNAGPTVGTVSTTGGIRLYYLANPANGSNTLSIAITGGPADELFVHVFSYYNVTQATPFGSSVTQGPAATNNPTLGAMTIDANEVGLGFMYAYFNGNMTVTQSDSLILETEGTSAASARASQVGDANLSWTLNQTPDAMSVGVPLNHDAGGAASGLLLRRRRH